MKLQIAKISLKKFFRENYLLIILVVAGFISHFIFFGRPKQTVFDEVYFGKFVSDYFTHKYFFDIHPPLGKLLIAGFSYLGGFKPGQSFATIGTAYSSNIYLWMRFLPTLAGAALPIIIYFLGRRLGLSKIAAFAAGVLIISENSILVQSRFILVDAFLLLFGFASLLSTMKYRQEKKDFYLYLSGILAAMSLSVKWTGATFLALIICMISYDFFILFPKSRKITLGKTAGKAILALIIIPFIIYFGIFVIHLKILNHSGDGDAFMTPEFQKNLAGSIYQSDSSVRSKNLWQEFIELNREMYRANATLTAKHPYQSSWISWPWMIRPIYYWVEAGNQTARIYFFGNPAIYWLSSLAILFAAVFWLARTIIFFIDRKLKIPPPVPLVIIVAYLFNFLPFSQITRAMFLYHYMAALIFAILALCFIIDKFKNRRQIFISLIIAALLFFIYFAPFSYGLPLSDSAYNARVWFSSWK